MGAVPHRIAPDSDRGSVTAEYALVLPLVLATLAFIIAAVTLGAHKIVLTSVAADYARFMARDDSAAAQASLAQLNYKTAITQQHYGQISCYDISGNPGVGPLSIITITARGCAAKTE